ncbi:hypothetical protein EYB45_05970 [Erythrobacteraceae bacterium CFH 75059]|uniref:hypothetical protein n=1 Tax=Qipengyuania thermophila TaxID=2509361 RepID=UPI00101FB897|nr:hypothetical protein [Qipengyuania thermophila]TCD05061.1 hypothetical protein EYB45_05970 [Erythrobacteraceae bacterium CFH 75059]
MVFHRLLACFALLTGLTIAGVPAFARDAAVEAPAVEGRENASAACAYALAALVRPRHEPLDAAPELAVAQTGLKAQVPGRASVRLRIDRAHE